MVWMCWICSRDRHVAAGGRQRRVPRAVRPPRQRLELPARDVGHERLHLLHAFHLGRSATSVTGIGRWPIKLQRCNKILKLSKRNGLTRNTIDYSYSCRSILFTSVPQYRPHQHSPVVSRDAGALAAAAAPRAPTARQCSLLSGS